MGLARRQYDIPRCFCLGQSAQTYPAQSACSMMLEYSPKLTQLGTDTGAVKHRALQRNKICKSNQGYHLVMIPSGYDSHSHGEFPINGGFNGIIIYKWARCIADRVCSRYQAPSRIGGYLVNGTGGRVRIKTEACTN